MSGPRFRHARARCPGCGRTMAVRVPRGGDGSVYGYPGHYGKPPGDRRCSWSHTEVDVRDVVAEAAGVPRGGRFT